MDNSSATLGWAFFQFVRRRRRWLQPNREEKKDNTVVELVSILLPFLSACYSFPFLFYGSRIFMLITSLLLLVLLQQLLLLFQTKCAS